MAKREDILERAIDLIVHRLTLINNTLEGLNGRMPSMGEARSMLTRLQSMYPQYYQNLTEISLLKEYIPKIDFEVVYGNIEARLFTIIDSISIPIPIKNPDQPHTCKSEGDNYFPHQEIPTFSGEYLDWYSWRELYVEIIHKSKVTYARKFQTLYNCLKKGKAFKFIDGLAPTNENYESAWESICAYYDDEPRLKTIHIQKIYDIKPIVKENDLKLIQELVNVVEKHLAALKGLNEPVDEWDLILCYHICQKVDRATRSYIEDKRKPKEDLRFSDLINILKDRIRFLEATSNSSAKVNNTNPKSSSFLKLRKPGTSLVTTDSNPPNLRKCQYCSQDHSIFKCIAFEKKSWKERNDWLVKSKLCRNCLGNHSGMCKSSNCRSCGKSHHTLLHVSSYNNQSGHKYSHANSSSQTVSSSVNNPVTSLPAATKSASSENISYLTTSSAESSSCLFSATSQILINTAVIWVYDQCGSRIPCRVVLDSASHNNFVTTEFAQILKLPRKPSYASVTGIGQSISNFKYKISVKIQSRVSEFNRNIDCLIIKKIADLPLYPIQCSVSSVPSSIQLADPCFYKPQKIDMLIGAELYDELLLGNQIQVSPELPLFRETKFGYTVSGAVNQEISSKPSSYSFLCFETDSLRKDLQKFWSIEEINSSHNFTIEEKACEEFFEKHITRDSTGRYTVSLPFKINPNVLGETSKASLNQFLRMENKLIRNEKFRQAYCEFIQEYLKLNHMRLINLEDISNKIIYYVPHHAVINENSTTTQLRVVFNASFKTSTGFSLNDILMVGPTIQSDLFSHLIHFRENLVAITGDLTKMYRQVKVLPDERISIVIYWRFNKSEPVRIYELGTVTYGTSPASYLAVRTLKQLAIDEFMNFPNASSVLINRFYVDDLSHGTENEESAISLKTELTDLLNSGGFKIHKWCSNRSNVVGVKDRPLPEQIKVLGVQWNHLEDTLPFTNYDFPDTTSPTKRDVLSIICTFFDPLGLHAPITFIAKLLMQKLWSESHIDWNDPIPESILKEWLHFLKDLKCLSEVIVPRCIRSTKKIKSFELHGFCDASERGYGCAIYIRSVINHELSECHLLCAKTKVAPIKRQTIPRLELCAALLLAELYNKVIHSLEMKISEVYLWSDSEITLYRINSPSANYCTFVSNRVSQIQDLSSPEFWHFIPTALNPADIASRGLFASQVIENKLWWHGPTFLYTSDPWPETKFPINHVDDTEIISVSSSNSNAIESITLLSSQNESSCFSNLYSDYSKMIRIAAYCKRFIDNCRNRKARQLVNINVGELSCNDLRLAEYGIVKVIQNSHFKKEIRALKQNQKIPKQSHIKNLCVFIDSIGLLRVKGRLEHSSFSEDQKNPMLLPICDFSNCYIRHIHEKQYHVGPSALHSFVRQKFWVISGKRRCNQVVRQCFRCFRSKPTSIEQLMGQLPSDRVHPHRAFLNVGIDFAGPFAVKTRLRSNTTLKAYLVLFICFSTKAIHLEVTYDLSTSAFISAFRMFISRRGKPCIVYSDNATNFVGANNELKKLHDIFFNQLQSHTILKYFADEGIEWLNIPPRSPHFGGLWESGVKSFKTLLKKSLGSHICNPDEFYCFVVQCEAILNSRPITPVSEDINDYSALTPGHFLIGAPLNSLPEPSLAHLQFNKLNRYQRIQYCMQQLWDRWSNEYIVHLQQRTKWNSESPNLKIGSLVLLKDDNIPPMKWVMGRIVQLHPGTDGLVRVVTVKTISGNFKRAITKICPLPSDTIAS